jgi:transmembrane sensor
MTPEPTLPVPPSDTPEWELLGRFFAGECEPADAARVSEWLAEHPDDARVAEAVNAAAATLGAALQSPVDTEGALATVLARRSPPLRRYASRSRYAAAAAILLMATAYLASRAQREDAARTVVASSATELKVFSTSVGERDSMQLPDGTRVMLGPESSLRYAADYGFESRTVTLVGDGYFDVAPGQVATFTVHAGPAVIVDLGTAFTVRTDDARGVLVAVTDGRVTLAADSSPMRTLELAAGEAGVLDRASGAARIEAVSVNDAAAWTTGALVFRDAPFADVASALRRWHGIELLADSAVRAARLTATFQDESKETVLETIALSYGAQRVTARDTVRLRISGTGRAPQ